MAFLEQLQALLERRQRKLIAQVPGLKDEGLGSDVAGLSSRQRLFGACAERDFEGARDVSGDIGLNRDRVTGARS